MNVSLLHGCPPGFHKIKVLLNDLYKRSDQQVENYCIISNPIYQNSWLKAHVICISEPELIVKTRSTIFDYESCNRLLA